MYIGYVQLHWAVFACFRAVHVQRYSRLRSTSIGPRYESLFENLQSVGRHGCPLGE